MAYTDIISLADAKNYLRIDDTLTADDALLGVMIGSAFQYIEKYTNHIFVATDKTYYYDECVARVYDHPINTNVLPDFTSEEVFELYSRFRVHDSDIKTLELNVGYESATEVPQELIMVAYELINIFYYGKDTGNIDESLSAMSRSILFSYKRYLL